MITKIYGIYGYREACITVPVSGDGKSYLKISFTNGNPQHGAYYRPATYVCVDGVEQNMIENSAMFGSTIKLIQQFGNDEGVHEVSTSAVAEGNGESKEKQIEFQEFPDVTNVDEMRAFLKAQGAKAPTLTSENAMKKYAATRGFVFPNLEL